jgi:hypothetical protein
MNRQTEAAFAIANVLRPGDVINTGWEMKWWDVFRPNSWLGNIACWRIQEYQEDYFGDRSIHDSTHTRIYLGRDKMLDIDNQCIFEVTVPRSRFVSLRDISLEDIRILRFTPRILTSDDIHVMLDAAQRIVGKKYDYLQLVGFLMHQILDYPREPFTLFDQGPERKVCSTGVAALFNHLRKVLDEHGGDTIPRLFDIVDVDVWKDRGVFDNIDQCLDPDATPGVDSIRTPIERVTPAHFENSSYFQNEFWEVVRFKNRHKYYNKKENVKVTSLDEPGGDTVYFPNR